MSSNELSRETSPYLLQHADNPVHWLAWGERAFERARAENKPILLSVGYAACHWCHVMAHESFEDEATAELMNAHFICVKVDREERPDVDRIYMDALHALGEQGGWPLTMFIAPDGSPFWGGTYFPKENQYGRPSFQYVLKEIARLWQDEPGKIDQNRNALLHALRHGREASDTGTLSPSDLSNAAQIILGAMDTQNGGLKGAPKFPQCSLLDFLWRRHLNEGDAAAGQAVILSLTRMAQGGIYDHLGGGFSRYAVDSKWLVPHFEKMLYDNAQLILLMARAWSQTNAPLLQQKLEETVRFVLESMRDEAGAFTASYDADSEGVEGKYYVWSQSEITELLGPEDSNLFCAIYDVTPGGNWEHSNILNRLHHPEMLGPEVETRLSHCRAKLLAHRATRIPPGHDDKILADWNGLMIKALAEAGQRLQRPDWIAAAEEAFITVLNRLWEPGQLHHSTRLGERRGLATADDYANLISAGLSLYMATAEPAFLTRATELTDEMLASYWDDERGGFFFTSERTADLLLRTRYAHDDATPSANGTMLSCLRRLYWLTGRKEFEAAARQLEAAFGRRALENPFAHGSLLAAIEESRALVQAVFSGDKEKGQAWLPALLKLPIAEPLIYFADESIRLPPDHPAAGKGQPNDTEPTLYLCRGMACSLPIRQPEDIPSAWQILQPSGIHRIEEV